MLPSSIRFVLVGSRFSKRTVPVALASSTRLPVAGNSSSTETGIVISSAGTTPAAGSGWVAAGSATTVSSTGVTRLGSRRDDDRRRRQEDVQADATDEQGEDQDRAADEPRRPDPAERAR